MLALIRGLPEDARWTRFLEDELEDADLEKVKTDLDPEELAKNEARFWTPDRLLMATLINAVYQNTQATGMWKDGKAPEMPVIGPSNWQASKPETKPAEIQKVEDAPPTDFLLQHMNRLGMPAGGGRMRF